MDQGGAGLHRGESKGVSASFGVTPLALYKVPNYCECADGVIVSNSVTTTGESLESNEMRMQISRHGLTESYWGYRVTVAGHDKRRTKDPLKIVSKIKF